MAEPFRGESNLKVTPPSAVVPPAPTPAGCRRVLFVIDTLEVGGAEQSLLLTGPRLQACGYQLVVCHLYRGGELKPQFQAQGVPVISLDLPGKYQFGRAFWRLRQVVRGERPDLLHTTLFRADQVGRAVARYEKIPVISSFVNISYDPLRLAANPHINPRKLAGLRRLDAWTARWVTRFHAVSEAVKASNCRSLGVPAERVTVVPRGRVLETLETGETRRRETRRQLGCEQAFPLLLNVGRLVDQKAQRYLIEAMPAVLARFPQAALCIAGEGILRDELQRRIDERGLAARVRLLGHRSDVFDLLHAADAFVFPSIYEGLPGAVIEAMLAGCPVIASDIDVIREAIDDGESGLLVPPRDVQALADAVLRLAADGEHGAQLARQARQVARERYDIERVAAATAAMYDEVLAEVTRGPRGVRVETKG